MKTMPLGRPGQVRILNNILMVAIVTALLICYGCGPKEKESPATPSRYGGTLYIGVETPFYGIDVLGGGSGGILLPDMAFVNKLIQEPLFLADRSGNVTPVLGLSATPDGSGKSWVIVLRQGVQFHDKTPFTADAVVHHWSRMLDPENRFRGRKIFEPINTVEKIDAHTVRFNLDHPWPSFIKVISDQQYLSSFIPSPKAVDEGTHDEKPVGTGPFKYFSWNRGDHYVVMKNSDYWREGRPFLNKIVFRVIPDHQSRYASLMAGELDAIVMDRGNLIQKAVKDDALHLYQSEGNGAEIVMLNTRVAPLDDVRVRRALALANNQELHVKIVYGDAIPLIHHPFGEWFRCRDDDYPEHDLEEAKRLIAQYGKPIELELLHTNTSRGRQIGELLQQLYKKIGVTLKPVGLSTGPVVMKVMKGDYQMTTWRILSANDHGPRLYRNLHSQSPANFSGYQNPNMDRLLEAQRSEADQDRRDAYLCEIAGIINRDIPFFYRGGRRYNILAQKRIDMLDTAAPTQLDLAVAWIDDAVNFNTKAFALEQKSKVPQIECLDPGDTDAVNAILRGGWEGKDDWGATITMTFLDDNTVTGRRTGSDARKGKYTICGHRIFFGSSAKVEITVAQDELVGQWKKASYTGSFTLKRIPPS